MDEINREFKDKKILIVGHGGTIDMYFAKLLGELDRVYERMQRNDFCDWGAVRDGKVLKDLRKDFERAGERLV